MKRPCDDCSSTDSELEDDLDVGRDAFHPGSMKASFVRCGSPNATTQVMARKKRRGIIEKRRRDRINNSLLELRRLVPTAFEKQGSAKLEKAEILQMTVDHLKMLQVAGGKGYLDAHALALDFLSLGFRECVTEVSRYLSAMEGLDSGDPLRSRLLSHLAACASQRDAVALTTASQFPPQHWAAAVATLHPLPYGMGGLPVAPDGPPQRSLPCTPAPPLSLPASFPIAFHGGFPLLPPPASFPSTGPPSSSSSQTPHSSSSKPYRPWGTEVGAF